MRTKTPQNISSELCGLDEREVLLSREKHGRNTLTLRPPKSFLARFLSNLSDPVIKILLAALLVNLVFVFRGGDIYETVGIGISVFLAAFISTLSESGSERAFRELSREISRSECRVLRGGRTVSILQEDVVVGDIVLLGAGEQIAADGLIVRGEIKTDQSAMTGESREKRKVPSNDTSDSPDSPSFVFRGCTVISGEGYMKVVRVGDKTYLGRISEELQEDTRPSPLKIRLAKLARQISVLGYIAASLVAAGFLFNAFVIDSGFSSQVIMMKLRDIPYILKNALSAFMLGLTVIVVAVPEGLPMMIAVVLSSNIKRMIRANVLVRKPVGIEAAGSMNILFTDKTGTLTEGKMCVGKIILGDAREADSAEALRGFSPKIFEIYNDSCRLNTSASAVGSRSVGGNATERALLDSVLNISATPRVKLLRLFPFDSERKYSLAALRDGLILIKGAPELLLARVDRYLTQSGEEVSFNAARYSFSRKLKEETSRGSRLLVIAYGRGDARGTIPESLTLVCAVLLDDRIRKESRDAVSTLHGAGISVVMITGDNLDTACAIAKKCGIIDRERTLCMDSETLAGFSDEELRTSLPSLAVVARALPADKSRLVRVAQEAGLVCGMTGDGINDAPALKCADIGFAMGGGTQVAKDAGDIIIIDNNLRSIASAVLYGRNIFKSIRKFITLQLTMNFCAVAVSMICPFLGIDSPVTVVQMLWINMIMDTLGGLAFAGEAPSPSIMQERPKRRDEPILNGYMINQILTLGTLTVLLCIAFLKLPEITSHFRYSPDNIYLLTAFFALFIFSSVFNCFNTRTDRLNLAAGLLKNRAFCIIMLLIVTVQIAFIYLGGSVLRTAPLSAQELIFTMLLSLLVFPADLIRKLIWKLFFKKDSTCSF